MHTYDRNTINSQQAQRSADELCGLPSIRAVLTWMQREGLPFESLDVVTQDEFSHDVLVPLGPSGEWAAFGVT